MFLAFENTEKMQGNVGVTIEERLTIAIHCIAIGHMDIVILL